jgi:hypothetical protein
MLTSYNAILVEEANRLDGDLYERSIHTSPWIDLVDTGAFPEGIGDIISTMIWERTLPSSPITWKNLMGADNSSASPQESILPPVLTVKTAKTLREYRLQHAALESENLNVNDLRTAVIRDEQLTAVRDNLSMNTNYLWRIRIRQEYDRLVNHVSLKAAGNTEGASADLNEANLPLTNTSLTRYRNRIIRMGGGRRPLDRVDGAPIFALICDSEVSDALKQETAIGDALHFAGRSNELLAPLGVERAYKNFFHIIDDTAPRFFFDASAGVGYEEVLPYTAASSSPTTGRFGQRVTEGSDYENAAFTRSYIFHQDVMKLLYPNSVTGAPGVTFDPVMYRGDWKWVNVQNMDPNSVAYNPDSTIGKFRGVFASATKAAVTEYGLAITHLRPGFASQGAYS